MKLKHRPIWMALAVPLVGLYLTTLTTVTTVGAVEPVQQPEPPREGTCEEAEVLFPDTNPGPGSLKEIPVPEPSDLATYVRNREAAIVLGKALFWDMQVGSDGVQACASCHFRGGRRSAVDQSGQSGRPGQSRPDDLRRPELSIESVGLPAAPAGRSHRTATRRCCAASTTSSRRKGVHLRQFVRAERGAIKDDTAVGARPGVQHPGHQHAPLGAAEHADDDSTPRSLT